MVAFCGAPIRRFCWPGETVEPITPSPYRLVTIPTTSGTGSEVTGGAVMYHEGHKVSGAHPNNRADWTLVDPLLTHGLPPLPTLYTAADALAQALAAVVVAVRTPIGDAVGLEATRICGLAMRAVVREPDAAARNQMALGSMMAGLAMNISEAGTEHALGEPLGTLYHLPHGLTIGLVLAESMDVDRRHVPERFERIADALGAPADGTARRLAGGPGGARDPGRDGLPDDARLGRPRGGRRVARRPLPRGLDPGRAGPVDARGHRRRLPGRPRDRASASQSCAGDWRRGRASAAAGQRKPSRSARFDTPTGTHGTTNPSRNTLGPHASVPNPAPNRAIATNAAARRRICGP